MVQAAFLLCPPTDKSREPSHLFLPSESDEVFRHLYVGAKHSPNKACQAKAAVYKKRALRGLIKALTEGPEGMASQHVVLPAHVKRDLETVASGSAHLPVMKVYLLKKCSRLPALHASSRNSYEIDAADPSRSVSSDVFEALAPKYLALTGHMLGACKSVIIVGRCV